MNVVVGVGSCIRVTLGLPVPLYICMTVVSVGAAVCVPGVLSSEVPRAVSCQRSGCPQSVLKRDRHGLLCCPLSSPEDLERERDK